MVSILEKTTGNFLELLGYIKNNFFKPAEQITRSQLSPGQFHALSTLYHRGGLPMSELAAELKISKQQLTPLICKLIDRQLVVRKADDQDRRVVRIEISEEGRTAFQDIIARMKQTFAQTLGLIPEHELAELDEMLIRIKEILYVINRT